MKYDAPFMIAPLTGAQDAASALDIIGALPLWWEVRAWNQ